MTDPMTWATIIVAFALGGVVKGVTGVGLPLIALPAIAARLGVPAAIVIIALPAIVTNFWQVGSFRQEARGLRFLPGFLAAGMAGIAIGTVLLVKAPESLLSTGLGCIVVMYIALRLAKPDLGLSERAARLLAPFAGGAAGLLQGLTGLAAPIGVTFLHSLRLSREPYLFVTSAMFLLFALVQLSAVTISGLVTAERLIQGVAALVSALAFMPVGSWIGSRLKPAIFDRIILLLLAFVAAQLIYNGVWPAGT